jgi:Tol biopolymer transport system component
MRPDGTGVTKVTDSHGFSGEPAWSPDGSLIAFSSDRGVYPQRQAIYVIRPDGTGMRQVTEKPRLGNWQARHASRPTAGSSCSPRLARHPASARWRGRRRDVRAVHDQPRRQQAAQDHALGDAPGDADWSPDGKRIVFETIFEWPAAPRASGSWTRMAGTSSG